MTPSTSCPPRKHQETLSPTTARSGPSPLPSTSRPSLRSPYEPAQFCTRSPRPSSLRTGVALRGSRVASCRGRAFRDCVLARLLHPTAPDKTPNRHASHREKRARSAQAALSPSAPAQSEENAGASRPRERMRARGARKSTRERAGWRALAVTRPCLRLPSRDWQERGSLCGLPRRPPLPRARVHRRRLAPPSSSRD